MDLIKMKHFPHHLEKGLSMLKCVGAGLKDSEEYSLPDYID